jgi:hypothetical protein
MPPRLRLASPAQRLIIARPLPPVSEITHKPTDRRLIPLLLPQNWRGNLVALQPKVQVADATLLGAMALMREFATLRLDLSGTLHSSPPHLFTYTAAAMWLVSKTCDIRTGARRMGGAPGELHFRSPWGPRKRSPPRGPLPGAAVPHALAAHLAALLAALRDVASPEMLLLHCCD